MPRIQIVDDNQNWLNWGTLVRKWIKNEQAPPKDVGELKGQFRDYAVNATVPGSDDKRKVKVEQYSDDPEKPLEIYIPSQAMLAAKMALIGQGPGPYPYSLMPLFYNSAYAEARRADLSVAEKEAFALRRIGEYTVNECC